MYAIVRKNTYDRAKLAQGRAQLEQFDALHARQPGFQGTMTIEVGAGTFVLINVWASQAAATAGLEALRPAVRQLVEPLLAAESTLIGEGPVSGYPTRGPATPAE